MANIVALLGCAAFSVVFFRASRNETCATSKTLGYFISGLLALSALAMMGVFK